MIPRNQIDWEILVWWVQCKPEQLIVRLNKHIKHVGEHRLWISGLQNCNGGKYGSLGFRWGGKRYQIYAHRLFLMLRLQSIIPDGFHASHDHAICEHPNCVYHVFLEDEQSNIAESNRRRHG